MPLYQHSSKYHAKTHEEWLHNRYLEKKKLEEEYEIRFKDEKKIDKTKESAYNHARALLDSSLITATNQKTYTVKIRELGDYYQVTYYPHKKKIKDKSLEKDFDMLYTPEEYKNRNTNDLKKIEEKNIKRSKYNLQNLVKANEKQFKTFITLTFADNITDIVQANKKFHIWRTKVKSIKKDFLYVCVPEFQKRGAVHYHLLTNLDIKENPDLIIPQENKANQYDVKYWSYGFSSVFSMKDINVVGYLSKYMTKKIDQRLFGRRRYFYSQKLKTSTITYLNLDDLNDYKFFVNCFNGEVCYQKTYLDYFGDEVVFKEYKRKEVK